MQAFDFMELARGFEPPTGWLQIWRPGVFCWLLNLNEALQNRM